MLDGECLPIRLSLLAGCPARSRTSKKRPPAKPEFLMMSGADALDIPCSTNRFAPVILLVFDSRPHFGSGEIRECAMPGSRENGAKQNLGPKPNDLLMLVRARFISFERPGGLRRLSRLQLTVSTAESGLGGQ